ncbi:MAG TPA: Uma2 family endonuclease [Methylomirabilota bacterium]|jgi:Uma2 family endonuclease|nr:Uma2 family endonuclease [Methylomirabilota bacterium]
MDSMTTYPVRNRHWTRSEYDQLIRIGFFFGDEPIELLGGQLIVAEPKGSQHQTAIGLTAEALRLAFGLGWIVRVQGPVALDDESEPEPDIAVVPGGHRDYLAEHPARPALLIEVAESSLAFDRRHKGSLYARAGVADYWIVNLVDEALEVYRQPAVDRSAEFGWRYLDVQIFRVAATVSPLSRPDVTVAVADLLP